MKDPSTQTAAREAMAAFKDPGIPGIRLVTKLDPAESAGKTDTLYRLAFSPTGTHLAATRNGSPGIWQVASGRALEVTGAGRNADLDCRFGCSVSVPSVPLW